LINQSRHGSTCAAMAERVLPRLNVRCHGRTCAATAECALPRINVCCRLNVPFIQSLLHEMHSEEDRSQPPFDSNFLHEIQLRTARPEQFRPCEPWDIDWFESQLNVIKLKHRFYLTLTDQTNPILTKPEDDIVAYGYHKKYKYPDPSQPSKSARIEWFFSTSDDALTSCDNASTCHDASTTKKCHDAFPLLALILVHQKYIDTFSIIVALPSYLLLELRAFIRQLHRNLLVEAYLGKISLIKLEGTPHLAINMLRL
jgi:hypothetical protein